MISAKKNLLKILIFTFCLALGILWIFRFEFVSAILKESHYVAELKQTYLQNSPESELKKHISQIEEDANVLSQYSVFEKSTTGISDASAFLNPLFNWTDESANNAKNANLKLKGKLAIPDEVVSLMRASKNLGEIKVDWSKSKVDLSWFSKIHTFDHWSFDLFGPVYHDIAALQIEQPELKSQAFMVIDLPLLESSDLVLWAKLRLLQGRDLNDLREAFRDVSHFARLVMTHENLVGTMTALAILNLETDHFNSLTKAEQKNVAVQIIPKVDLDRARRYFQAQSSFVDRRLSMEMFKRLSSLPLGLCQRVQEGIFNQIGLRRILKSENIESHNRFVDLVKQSSTVCRKSYLRSVFENWDYQGLFAEDQTVIEHTGLTIKKAEHYPGIALALAYSLLSVSEPKASFY